VSKELSDEQAVQVLANIANGSDKIISVKPEWENAWCEDVEIKTLNGRTVVVFHRWGSWKYTSTIEDQDGNLWDYSNSFVDVKYLLSKEDAIALNKLLPWHRDKEEFDYEFEKL
jgi:hypothetical protein